MHITTDKLADRRERQRRIVQQLHDGRRREAKREAVRQLVRDQRESERRQAERRRQDNASIVAWMDTFNVARMNGEAKC